MAKIELNAPLLARIEGPAGNARWRMKGNPAAEVRAEGQHLSHGRKPELDPRLPLLFTPRTYRADCDAWKWCDRAYQRMPQAGRDNWRRAVTKPHTSAYDAYMRQNIPHALRGWPGPADPRGRPGWSLRTLYPRQGWWYQAPPIWDGFPESGNANDATAYPPNSCRLWGLGLVAARMWFIRSTFPPPDDEYYVTDVAIYTHTGYDDDPAAGRRTVAIYGARRPGPYDPDDPYDGWPLLDSGGDPHDSPWSVSSTTTQRRPHAVAVLWEPAHRNRYDQVPTPWTYDADHATTVALLGPRHLWSHWSHPYPTGKPSWADTPTRFRQGPTGPWIVSRKELTT